MSPSPRRSRSRSRGHSPASRAGSTSGKVCESEKKQKSKEEVEKEELEEDEVAAPVVEEENNDKVHKFCIRLQPEDVGFLQGKKGRTKMKLEKVSGVELEIQERPEVLIRGKSTDKYKIKIAEKYVRCLIQQRKGDFDPELMKELLKYDDNDLTQFKVPQDAVAFVTGRQGCFLRQCEEDWNVLMFFSEFDRNNRGGNSGSAVPTKEERPFENLAIFGQKRNRRGAELKILSAVETKVPGFFKSNEDEILNRDKVPDDSSIVGDHKDDLGENYEKADWKTDVLRFKDNELSFALGNKGATRKKLEVSSGCIVEYLGHYALFSGTEPQRTRIKEYLRWLFEQLEDPVHVSTPHLRSDLTMVEVPEACVGYIMGVKRCALSQIEADNGVLMFFVGKPNAPREGDKERRGTPGEKVERLAILGPERGRLASMLRVQWSVDLKNPGKFSNLIKGENRDEWENDKIQIDYMKISQEDIGYTLGKRGATKQKIVQAANCELQYLGRYACMVGCLEERRNCKDYMKWLLEQRQGRMCIELRGRKDVLALKIPPNFCKWIGSGACGLEIRQIEEDTSTFCFLSTTKKDPDGPEKMMVCSTYEGHECLGSGRAAAEMRIRILLAELEDNGYRKSRTIQEAWSYGGGGYGGGYGGGQYQGYNNFGIRPPPGKGGFINQGKGKGKGKESSYDNHNHNHNMRSDSRDRGRNNNHHASGSNRGGRHGGGGSRDRNKRGDSRRGGDRKRKDSRKRSRSPARARGRH